MSKKPEKSKALTVIGRIFLVLLTTVLMLVLVLYVAMWMLVRGPSPTICRLFVNTVKETSAGGFLADLYLSEEEIEELRFSEDTAYEEEEIDSSLIQIPDKQPDDTEPSLPVGPSDPSVNTGDEPPVTDVGTENPDVPTPPVDDGIEIVDVSGPTYYGKLMIVKDPTRVFVGVPDHYGAGYSGLTVEKMIEKYDAIGGINAGGFYDPNGEGTGGIPDGLVIYEGELLWGNLDTSYWVAGLDANGLLYTSKMTARKALSLGIQYAASFGPALIINGSVVTENDSSLNPRTAIGQRADGALLLLVINGRAVDSLGATLLDVAGIMLDHGAVNATNLDGGSSSIMIHNGEYLTNSSYIFGIRVVATAFIVK